MAAADGTRSRKKDAAHQAADVHHDAPYDQAPEPTPAQLADAAEAETPVLAQLGNAIDVLDHAAKHNSPVLPQMVARLRAIHSALSAAAE